MYAVFQTGGKQFRAEPGVRLRIPSLEADEGSTISFDEVLLASDGEAVSAAIRRYRTGKIKELPDDDRVSGFAGGK